MSSIAVPGRGGRYLFGWGIVDNGNLQNLRVWQAGGAPITNSGGALVGPDKNGQPFTNSLPMPPLTRGLGLMLAVVSGGTFASYLTQLTVQLDGDNTTQTGGFVVTLFDTTRGGTLPARAYLVLPLDPNVTNLLDIQVKQTVGTGAAFLYAFAVQDVQGAVAV